MSIEWKRTGRQWHVYEDGQLVWEIDQYRQGYHPYAVLYKAADKRVFKTYRGRTAGQALKAAKVAAALGVDLRLAS